MTNSSRPKAVVVSSYLALMLLGVLDVAFLGFRWGFQGSWTAVLFLGLLPFAVAGLFFAAGNWLLFSLAERTGGRWGRAIPALFWTAYTVMLSRVLLMAHSKIGFNKGAVFAVFAFPITFMLMYKFFKYVDGNRNRFPDGALYVVFATLAIVAYWVSATVHVGLYDFFRSILTLVTVFMLWGLLELALSRRVRFRPCANAAIFVTITFAITVGAHFSASSGVAKYLVMERSVMAQRIYYDLIQRITDRDRDRFVSWLGGGDCAPFNRDINPMAYEIPGDGVDNNCTGRDEYLPSNPWMKLEPVPIDAASRLDMNVIWFSIDALRSDRLGVRGYTRDGKSITPNLDKFARENLDFVHAYVHYPGTHRGLMAMTRGKIARLNTLRYRNAPTIWELLEQVGTKTAGFFYTNYFTTGFDIARGMQLVDDDLAMNHSFADTGFLTAPSLVPGSLELLDGLEQDGEPFWFWTHIFEPHIPYMVREGFDFGRSVPERYDSEVAFSDQWFGRFIQGLKDLDLYDNSVIVVFADHGEEIYERGGLQHGKRLYEEEVRIPLLMRIPGTDAQTIEALVSLVDVVPTLVDYLNLPIDEPFSGRSLMPIIRGEPHDFDSRYLYGSLVLYDRRTYSVLRWPWKLIWHSRFSVQALYNLENDPGELVNRIDAEPEIAEELWTALFAWLEREELH